MQNLRENLENEEKWSWIDFNPVLQTGADTVRYEFYLKYVLKQVTYPEGFYQMFSLSLLKSVKGGGWFYNLWQFEAETRGKVKFIKKVPIFWVL